MHIDIGIIVEAEDEAEAKSEALVVAEELIVESVFDSVNNECVSASKVSSLEGQKIIQQKLSIMDTEFKANIERLRILLTDKEKCPVSQLRYYAYAVAQVSGQFVWLYDQQGCPVRTQEELEETLTQDKDELWGDLWVIEVDVHY